MKTSPALPKTNDPLATRRAALAVLNTWDRTRNTLDAVLADAISGGGLTSKRERDFLNALVFGVMRWRRQLDHYIRHFSTTAPQKMDAAVLNILRLALMQIVHMDRVPVSAAVNTAVELAKSAAAPWVVRFVNGVLRNAARHYRDVAFPDPQRRPADALSIGHAFPDWLIRRWLQRLDFEETDAACRALNRIAPIVLRANTLQTTSSRLIDALAPAVRQVAPGRYAPDAVRIESPSTPVAELPGYRRGWYQVQDEAAQLVTLLLNPQPSECILEACAGIGGKTGHIAQLMGNTGMLTAVEKAPAKLDVLNAQMRRLGIENVQTRTLDLSAPLDPALQCTFDRVLLDAPCSGLGVIRRNPDTKWRIQETDLLRLQSLQGLFLENLSPLVKPLGILVYAVCSTEPEETQDVVDAFLKRHPEYRLEPSTGNAPWPEQVAAPDGVLKTSPHRHDMDGFYAVRLRRIK